MKTLGDVGPGQTLGRYELLVPIAQGGMAVVWAARMKGTRGFQKTVAVKCMLPALSDDPQFEEMFLAEAGLASRIKHPHVCEILDLGEQDGLLYIVMEWVDGEGLGTLQKASRPQGGIPLSIAARIGLHAAAGLHAAHELKDDHGALVGLVHRDVSPQNILVTYDGVVKIVDFGVAKAASEIESGQTKPGQVKGKIPFMSPEQAMGKDVDRRTDIFALGIVVYQLAAGRHPFRGDNDMATLHNIVDPKPVPRLADVVPGCPAALSDAVAKALEKDPDARFATMLDFARALEKALAQLEEEDLGTFVRKILGERGEKRRAALKDALRVADERAKSGASIPPLDRTPFPPPSQASLLPASISSPPSMATAQSFVMPPEVFAPRRRGKWIAFGAIAAIMASATAVLLNGSPIDDASGANARVPAAIAPPSDSAPKPAEAPAAAPAPTTSATAAPAASASTNVGMFPKPKPGGTVPRPKPITPGAPRVSDPGF
jgi:serine/threonine-protein kinase